jgi:hypothetical protein
MLYAINRPDLEPILQAIQRVVRTGQFYELRMFIDEMKAPITRVDLAMSANP